MRLRIISMRSHSLTGGSMTYCGSGIRLFQGCNRAVFMQMLQVRVGPRRNTGVTPINLASSYQKQ